MDEEVNAGQAAGSNETAGDGSPVPVVAAKMPCVLEMAPGSYYWCSCGRSKSQPFCDGSHAGTGFEPVQFTVEKDCRMALCACKHSNNSYMCDGTHSKL